MKPIKKHKTNLLGAMGLFFLISYVQGFSQTLDTSFGTNGKAIFSNLSGISSLRSLAIDQNNNIYIGGFLDSGASSYFKVVGFTNNGALNTSFGANGYAGNQTANFRGNGIGLNVQNDGKILLTGTTNDGSADNNSAVLRFNTNGTHDTSFGNQGISIVNTVNGDYDIALSALVLSNGKILVGGDALDDIEIFLLNTDGTLDTNFGNNGKVIIDTQGRSNGFVSMIKDEAGNIFVLGTDITGDFSRADILITKLKADGSLDTSFGNSGIVTTGEPADSDFPYKLFISSDGNLYVSGNYIDSNDNSAPFIRRYSSNGILDTSFGTSGLMLINELNSLFVNSVIVNQEEETFYVGGSIFDESFKGAFSKIEKDGSINTEFGTNGIVEIANSENVTALVFDNDQKLVVMGSTTNHQGYYVARYNITVSTSNEEEYEVDIPTALQLDQNYPNPFNPSTTISFNLTRDSNVSLRIYDLLGREVEVLVDGRMSAGTYTKVFDARNLPSGIYFYQLSSNQESLTKKMTLVK